MFIKITMMLALMIVGACSSGPEVKEFPDSASATEELKLFETDLQTASNRQVDVLSPNDYYKAQRALKSAQEDQKDGDSNKDILRSIAKGRAYLDRATKNSETARTNMEEVVIARQEAMTAGGLKFSVTDFNRADDNLRSLTTKIERNDLSDIQEKREGLQSEYRAIELNAIKYTNLGSARENVAQAKEEGAEEYAKESLASVEKKLNDAEAFIAGNRKDKEAITVVANDVTDASKHLLKITRVSKYGRKVGSEKTALMLDNVQTVALEQSAENKDLKSDRSFNQSFEKAQSEFAGSEAEVYRQGDNLVIRLRDLKFPVNKSTLRGSNFPLLSKVATVIKGFDNPTVVVEGHTDSDGGKKINQQLSMDRSEAVADYLISNEVIDRKMITHVGYGYDRPLATNKTTTGKAQNRRVDIIITPSISQE